MSPESDRTESGSYTADEGSASTSGCGSDRGSETLADEMSDRVQLGFQEDELDCDTAGDDGTGKRNECIDTDRKTESVNGESDLGVETLNVDVETSGVEKKFPDVNGKPLKVGEDTCDGKDGDKFRCEDSCVLSRANQDGDLDDGSDLVWAKVRSHPWWPGQRFDASAASEKAKKYFKKGSFLVTYFGDHTFAWNHSSHIKPFRQHFSQMDKQSKLSDFHDAIDCALEEVSRRIEFGLSCHCVSKETYNKIKTQNIMNPGILKESSVREGGDKISNAAFFEPAKLVGYIKSIACKASADVTNMLDFVTHRARLLAFHRWKGYSDLPEFETLLGSLESAPKIPLQEGDKGLNVSETTKPNNTPLSKKRKTEGNKDSGSKRRFGSKDMTANSEKEETLSEFLAKKCLSKRKENRSDKKYGLDRISEKRNNPRMHDLAFEDFSRNDVGIRISAGDSCNLRQKAKPRPGFGIGASILRVASQMNSSTPTILRPCSRGSTPKMVAKNKKRENESVPEIPSEDNNPTEEEDA